MMEIQVIYEAIFGESGDLTITMLKEVGGNRDEFVCVTTQTTDDDQAFTMYRVPDVNPVVDDLIDIVTGFNVYSDIPDKSIYIPHLHTLKRPCTMVRIEMDDTECDKWVKLHVEGGEAYNLDEIPVVSEDTQLPFQSYFQDIIARFKTCEMS